MVEYSSSTATEELCTKHGRHRRKASNAAVVGKQMRVDLSSITATGLRKRFSAKYRWQRTEMKVQYI
jgi:hypothetical protein